MSGWIHRALAERFPTIESAVSEIAALKAQLELPKGVIHVISDIHGEAKKLRHVINNASGRLRPLVSELFEEDLDPREFREFLNVLYYPAEILQLKEEELRNDQDRFEWVLATLRWQFDLIRRIISQRRRKTVKQLAPKEHRELFEVLLNFPAGGHDPVFLEVQLREMVRRRLDFSAIRSASRFIRNLTVEETIVAGDLGDRGPRLDRVVDYLMRQPNVSLIWGNHDVSWMGACLGNEALIALVMRISLRYRRLYQLEEGYGLLTKALEQLAETAYRDDPAEHFLSKRSGERDPWLIARMHKAAAILEFKLQGRMIERHPEWEMDDRNLLPQIDYERGTLFVGGKEHRLRDTYLPTIHPADPNRLSPEEEHCMSRLKESFTSSPRLWEHMKWMANRGGMAVVRDRAVIFHACLAVDEEGQPLPLEIDGVEYRGPEQFSALNRVIKRAFRAGAQVEQEDLDRFYYLWAGPKSPLFGKDRMATFETYFIEDKATHKETKNPWFRWIHDFEFCDRICREMGVPEGGIIVNGHVPVKVEEGESPVKGGGNAVTIDGAFSEAYGDRGYTFILAPEGEVLAEHHAFPDPVAAVREGGDLIPTMQWVRAYDRPRMVGDTEQGKSLRAQIRALEELVEAYEEGEIQEH
ncbi:fructose-1,6-bisphosphatase-3 [Haloferula luteola]|uniref:Fructose-1,6-bisphosphatase-3 n=1 Tax=Haloferula luteola TaxID=595692 RepID=A0A840VAB3_9BACT|nr:fructose-bisphosphatase class III [Haloferula luteola]MBB5352494.1 fructose-1,6-bisphosphatase-3 [Haloferula luteola]